MSDEIDIDYLATLCRIKCTDDEKRALSANLKKILNYVAFLDEIDTEGVEPCTHIYQPLINVMEADIVGPTLNRNTFLANTPDHVAGMVKVPPVIQFEE